MGIYSIMLHIPMWKWRGKDIPRLAWRNILGSLKGLMPVGFVTGMKADFIKRRGQIGVIAPLKGQDALA